MSIKERIKAETVEGVILLIGAGAKTAKIAEVYGISQVSVNRIRTAYKIFTDEDWARLGEVKSIGKTIVDTVARVTGKTPPIERAEETADTSVEAKLDALLTAVKQIGILLENNTKAQYELLKIWRNG